MSTKKTKLSNKDLRVLGIALNRAYYEQGTLKFCSEEQRIHLIEALSQMMSENIKKGEEF